MKSILKIAANGALGAILATTPVFFTACDEDDEVIVYDISADGSQLTKSVAWDEVESSISFHATADWTASVSKTTSWITITVPSGEAGEVKMPFLLTENDEDSERSATVTIKCGEKVITITVTQEGNPNAAHIMDASTIKDYDKYIIPSSSNEGFQKGAEGMLRSDAKWSWWRMKQSEHFFVFWEPGFGDDPNAETVPEALRVDVDDLLEKAEAFFKTNVTNLGMATLGEGKSVLDNYKMQIYLLYQTEWLATGSGYDDVIGALWVNPSTCKPVGSTIGHEIGHSFQYQVSADKLYTGEAAYDGDILPVGFRYGFGENGAGGCAYWEQCAQWQSFQDYPEEAFTQDANVQVWLSNHHRHFNHEWQRYASYWFQYYFTQKQGLNAYAKIWKESKYPEDPIETYTRLYCNGDLNTLWSDMYEYASHCANYDFDAVHEYLGSNPNATNYSTKLYKTDAGYQISYENCPGTTGFNLIPLNVPAAGTTVTAELTGLEPGSALASADPGSIIDGDGNQKSTTTTYNKQSNTAYGFRFGFVAVKADGTSEYSEMQAGKSGTASISVPANTESLYLCVLGAPDTYNRHEWDDDMSDDEQWPYTVKFSGSDLLGNVELEAGDPYDVTISLSADLDYTSTSYGLKTYNLLSEGVMAKIAQALKLQPAEIASATLDAATASAAYAADASWTPSEGQVAVGITNPDGTISYAYSANGIGFWIEKDGTGSSWGSSPIYFEYTSGAYSLTIGHVPGGSEQGVTYVIKPTFVYNYGGTIYKAVVEISMNF